MQIQRTQTHTQTEELISFLREEKLYSIFKTHVVLLKCIYKNITQDKKGTKWTRHKWKSTEIEKKKKVDRRVNVQMPLSGIFQLLTRDFK